MKLLPRLSLISLIGLSTSFPAWADEPAATPTPVPKLQQIGDITRALQDPSGLKVDAGYLSNRRKGADSEFYYKVEYKGDILKERKASISESDAQKSGAAVFPGDGSDDKGDTHDLLFRFERGVGNLNGGIFDGLGIKPLQFGNRRSFLGRLRGTLQVTGQIEDTKVDVAAGLETWALHPLPASLKMPNWVILGVQRGTQSRNGGSSSQKEDVTLLTFRSFLAKGAQWRQSEELKETLRAQDEFAKSHDTYKKLRDENLSDTPIPDIVAKTQVVKDNVRDIRNVLRVRGMNIREGDINIAQFRTDIATQHDKVTELTKRYLNPIDTKTDADIIKDLNARIQKNGFFLDTDASGGDKTVAQDLLDDSDIPMPIKDIANLKLAGRPDNGEPGPAPDTDIRWANRLLLERAFPNSIKKLDDVWEQRIRTLFTRSTSFRDLPLLTLWVENGGWYSATGILGSKRLNNLFAATLTRWLDSSRNRSKWLRLRYEYGRDRAQPGTGKNFISASFGFAF
jgi:hypothetical protein